MSTRQQLLDYDSTLEEFRKLYSLTPGVMLIDEDHWDGSSFVVMVDDFIFKYDGSIPESYKGYEIIFYYVYDKLEGYNDVISFYTNHNLNQKMPTDYFHRQVKRLEEIINNYEASKI